MTELKKDKKIVEIKNGEVQSQNLFGEKKQITIIHNSQEYRLCITQNQKLILIK